MLKADILGIYYWHDYYDGRKAEQIKALLIKQKAFVEEAC